MWASKYAVINIVIPLLIMIVILCTTCTVASDGGPVPRILVAVIVILVSLEELQADSS